MEFLYEAIVMGFLTRGNSFCCPQYSIKVDSGKEDWRCPDFVVLDFEAPQVIIAEVTAGADMRPFATKAKELHDHGRQRIRKELMDRAKSTIPNIAEWPIEIQLFVCEDRKADLENRIGKLQFQAEVITLERAFQRWKESAK
jgi:hypothetical protein